MFSPLTIAALASTGVVAGALGALVGIGGGVLFVPALVLLFHQAPRIAVATSLVAVIATSTGAGSVYVGRGTANMRLGMSLEIATTIGGAISGLVAMHVPGSMLAGALSILLVVTAALLVLGKEPHTNAPVPAASGGPEAPAGERRGSIAGAYFDEHDRRVVHYAAVRWPVGAAISLLAGAVSGLLGVGGGFLKVPAMAVGMRVPIRVAAATSNFMIGVTAAASVSVYLVRGMVVPLLAAPCVLGVVAGSLMATRVAGKFPHRALRWLTAGTLLVASAELAFRVVHHHGF